MLNALKGWMDDEDIWLLQYLQGYQLRKNCYHAWLATPFRSLEPNLNLNLNLSSKLQFSSQNKSRGQNSTSSKSLGKRSWTTPSEVQMEIILSDLQRCTSYVQYLTSSGDRAMTGFSFVRGGSTLIHQVGRRRQSLTLFGNDT